MKLNQQKTLLYILFNYVSMLLVAVIIKFYRRKYIFFVLQVGSIHFKLCPAVICCLITIFVYFTFFNLQIFTCSLHLQKYYFFLVLYLINISPFFFHIITDLNEI